MQDRKKAKKPNDTQRSSEAHSRSAPEPDDYIDRNSGRRASGHGGGDMDTPEEFPEAHHEAGYEFSGGGHGHEPNRSLAHEIDEDLESRSGPYTRAGQPAQPQSDAEDADKGKANTAKKGHDTKK